MEVDDELMDALTRRNIPSGADAMCDRRELDDDLMDEPTRRNSAKAARRVDGEQGWRAGGRSDTTKQCTWSGSDE